MSEWTTAPLGTLVEIRVSNVDKKSFRSERSIRLCNYMDAYSRRYLRDADDYMEATCTDREAATFALQRGDLVITKDSEDPDDIAVPAMVDDDVVGLVCGYHLAILRPKAGAIDPAYLLAQLRSEEIRSYFARRASGSTRYGLSLRTIAYAPIRLAPKPHQNLAGQIQRTLDDAINHTEALIAKQERVRAGLMQDLFTRGVDARGRLRPPREEAPHLYHQTPLGWLPKEWETSLVRDIAEVVRGSTPRPAKDPRYFDGDFIPWITVGELSRDDWPYLESTTSMLTEWGSSFSRQLAVDTLVISNSGFGCGVPKILKLTGCANDGVAAFLNLSKEFNTLFLYYFLYRNIENIRLKVARGNDQPNLNTDMIGNLHVPKPKPSEQLKIADLLWGAQTAIRAARDNVDKLALQRTGLMRDLLTPPAAIATEAAA